MTGNDKQIDDAELARLGEYFYSNLSDALASAKRRDRK